MSLRIINLSIDLLRLQMSKMYPPSQGLVSLLLTPFAPFRPEPFAPSSELPHDTLPTPQSPLSAL